MAQLLLLDLPSVGRFATGIGSTVASAEIAPKLLASRTVERT